MIYRTLGDLRSELSRRLGFGAMGSAGINQGLLDSFLQNAQDQLFVQFDWRDLIKFDEKVTGKGQIVYDWAQDCNPAGIRDIAILDGDSWVPLTEGITWSMRSDNSKGRPCRFEKFQQMEVWPPPDRQYTIRRCYVASPQRFTQDNDRASIDDALILLHALANAKLHYKQPDGESYGNQLQAMMRQLKAKNRGASVHSRGGDSYPDVYSIAPRYE